MRITERFLKNIPKNHEINVNLSYLVYFVCLVTANPSDLESFAFAGYYSVRRKTL